jgi:fructokinase
MDIPGLEAEYLALGILNIVLVASPQRVIVGGGVVESRPLLTLVRPMLGQLLAGYLDASLLRERIDSYLVSPELADRAGVLGAIALAQQAG